MFGNSHKGYGLGLLPPWLRLILVAGSTSLLVAVNDLGLVIGAMCVGLILLLLNKRINWVLLPAVPFTAILVFAGNVLFSPPQAGGVAWAVFTVNSQGVLLGAIRGLRMGAMMSISFAWLFATSIPEMYAGLDWIPPAREWTLGILRGVQIARREFTILAQSLVIRGLKWDSIRSNVRNMLPLASGLIPMLMENAKQAAFASVAHHRSTTRGDAALRLSDVHVRYSPRSPDVLHEINMAVEPGEFVYVAGKNKAGKSSLLRVMGGVIAWIMGEFRGRVEVSGMLTHQTPLDELCGTVRYVAPDLFASIHGLTVGQEICFLAGNEKQARDVLDVMGLAGLWDRETTKLSGGQQVRLVLAGALASEPRVFLFDSPMQELDPPGRSDFVEALAILRAQRECTVVLADPFWRNLRTYVDRVAVLANGRLTANCAPGDFFANGWLEQTGLLVPSLEKAVIPPGDVVCEMRNVHVELEGAKILKGIDLTLREGELVAIMGPNGSGKTTAMLTLAGAIKPTKGTIKVTGRVGYVFQNARLQTVSMAVQDELSFGPRVLRWRTSEVHDFVSAGLEWTGLGLLDCPLDLHECDVRMLAVAAANTRVAALLLDEPTVGLDAAGISKIGRLVNYLRRQGAAIIIITHDEALGAQADRIITIRDGQVYEELQAPAPGLPGAEVCE